jgi:hypothetical protein
MADTAGANRPQSGDIIQRSVEGQGRKIACGGLPARARRQCLIVLPDCSVNKIDFFDRELLVRSIGVVEEAVRDRHARRECADIFDTLEVCGSVAHKDHFGRGNVARILEFEAQKAGTTFSGGLGFDVIHDDRTRSRRVCERDRRRARERSDGGDRGRGLLDVHGCLSLAHTVRMIVFTGLAACSKTCRSFLKVRAGLDHCFTIGVGRPIGFVEGAIAKRYGITSLVAIESGHSLEESEA